MKMSQTKQNNKREKSKGESRVKANHFSWKQFLVAYFVLSVLSAGQGMIYAEYLNLERMPIEYIFGMAGYWALVAASFTLVTHFQIKKKFDKPMRRLSQAAEQVAGGDFSVYIEPIHTSEKFDYVDVMFEDFNKMVEELGSTETMKNDFIANVSHEIKTPLSVIQNYAEMIKKETLSLECRQEYADIIISASKNLTTLVTNILKLNKLENQEISPATKTFDLCRQISECALSYENAWETKGVEFEAELDDRVMITADEGLLEIIWHNLLSNAIKFTPPGGKIYLTQTSEADSVTVSIADTGCGMDKETMKHIFDKFYQGDVSHSGEGNGLGLALVKRVVDLTDSTIEVESELGKGSIFTIRFKILQQVSN